MMPPIVAQFIIVVEGSAVVGGAAQISRGLCDPAVAERGLPLQIATPVRFRRADSVVLHLAVECARIDAELGGGPSTVSAAAVEGALNGAPFEVLEQKRAPFAAGDPAVTYPLLRGFQYGQAGITAYDAWNWDTSDPYTANDPCK